MRPNASLRLTGRVRTKPSSRCWVVLLGGVLAGSLSPLSAQESPEPPISAEPKPLCFRGKPLQACRAFALTEFSLAAWIGEKPPGENPPAAVAEFGLMRNLGRRSALGGSFSVDVGHQEVIAGLALRYRYWFNSTIAFDAGLGTPILGYARLDWATVKAKLNYGDLVGPVARLEFGGGTTYWSLGLEGGSYVGLLGMVAATAFGVVAVASL